MKNEKKEVSQREAIIQSLGVFELRGLAREFGISSPTTKKREELISLIFEKMKEGNVLDSTSQRRGRPFKKLNSLDEILNSVVPEEEKFSTCNRYDDVISFMQEEKPVIIDFDEEIGVFEGVIRKQEDNLFFVDSSSFNKVFVDNQIEVPTGAIVKAKAKKINKSNSFWASSLLEIDGKPFEKFAQTDFEKGEEIISNSVVDFAGGEAKEGRRNVFCYNEDLYENDNLEKLIKQCDQKGYRLILLSINTPFENMIKFKNMKIDLKFVTEYATLAKNSAHKLVDFINHSQYLINKGEKVVMFIPDILDVARKLDEVFVAEENTNLGYSQSTIVVLQQLFSIGRAYSNGASGTLIMGYNECNKEDRFLNADILRISKKIN